MNGTDFGQFLLGLIAAAIVIAIGIWLLHWLYLRSSKERAFVRTGLGGEKVVLGGGAFVLPIVHDVISVNMNTLRLEVSRGSDNALITKDRLRVDVVAEFYVRVQVSSWMHCVLLPPLCPWKTCTKSGGTSFGTYALQWQRT
jgi:uncharacterized membrane protein YqiK